MIDFKEKIAEILADATNLNEKELESYIEMPKDSQNGDYAFPCFRLAKELRKAPPVIANEIKEKIETTPEEIEKVEVVGGYLNFYINKDIITKEVLNQIENKEVVTQVNDTVNFPSYKVADDKTLIKQQMKEHIKNYDKKSITNQTDQPKQ